MPTICRSALVCYSAKQMFELVDDDEKIKLWMEGLEETIYTSPQDRENPVGGTFKQKIREGVGAYGNTS